MKTKSINTVVWYETWDKDGIVLTPHRCFFDTKSVLKAFINLLLDDKLVAEIKII